MGSFEEFLKYCERLAWDEDEMFCITGSSAWGLQTETSDIDYVTTPRISDRLKESANGIEDCVVLESDWNRSWKMIKGNVTINICPQHPVEYKAWQLATKLMQTLALNAGKSRLVDKQDRVSMFKLCLGVAYATLNLDEIPSS